MLLLADRGFFGVDLWQKAAATGADLLWRVRKDIVLPMTASPTSKPRSPGYESDEQSAAPDRLGPARPL
jgi:hypothetical protein